LPLAYYENLYITAVKSFKVQATDKTVLNTAVFYCHILTYEKECFALNCNATFF